MGASRSRGVFPLEFCESGGASLLAGWGGGGGGWGGRRRGLGRRGGEVSVRGGDGAATLAPFGRVGGLRLATHMRGGAVRWATRATRGDAVDGCICCGSLWQVGRLFFFKVNTYDQPVEAGTSRQLRGRRRPLALCDGRATHREQIIGVKRHRTHTHTSGARRSFAPMATAVDFVCKEGALVC